MNNNFEYINNKRKQKEAYYRFRLGSSQILHHPAYLIIMVAILLLFLVIWKSKQWFIPTRFVPVALQTMLSNVVSLLLVILFIMLELLFIRSVGVLAARKTESYLAIALKLTESTETPILISRKTEKQSGVTIIEFYSQIPMSVWKDTMDSIADILNVHWIAPHIEYGGKHNNNGRIIRLYMAKGRIPQERGVLYDDEL